MSRAREILTEVYLNGVDHDGEIGCDESVNNALSDLSSMVNMMPRIAYKDYCCEKVREQTISEVLKLLKGGV